MYGCWNRGCHLYANANLAISKYANPSMSTVMPIKMPAPTASIKAGPIFNSLTSFPSCRVYYTYSAYMVRRSEITGAEYIACSACNRLLSMQTGSITIECYSGSYEWIGGWDWIELNWIGNELQTNIHQLTLLSSPPSQETYVKYLVRCRCKCRYRYSGDNRQVLHSATL